MISIYLYFLASIAFFYLFIFFVHLYKKDHNEDMFYHALTFLFIFLICFSNSVPLLATDNLWLAAYGNVLSNIFLYCLIFSCFKVQLISSDRFFKNNVNSLKIVLLFVAITSTTFQLTYFSYPSISTLGVIWNLNEVTSALLSLTTFVYGLYWGMVFGKIAYILRDQYLKRRMKMISANGIMLGLSGLFIFQDNIYLTIVGILLLLVAAISTGVVFLIPENSEISKKKLSTA